jgi:hypothetical protein
MINRAFTIFMLVVLLTGLVSPLASPIDPYKPTSHPNNFADAQENIDDVDPVDPVDEDYIKGDANSDGEVTIDDAYFLIDFIFNGGEYPDPLLRGDHNEDGTVNISDVVSIINYLYENGMLDNEAPVIDLEGPRDGKTYEIDDEDDKKRVYFEFIVSDLSEIDTCSLYIDGDKELTKTNPDRDTKLTFVKEIDEGDYEWRIKCVDIYGNEGVSEQRDLEIEVEDDDNGDSNGNNYDYDYINDQEDNGGFNFNDFYSDVDPIQLQEEEKNSISVQWGMLLIIFLAAFIVILIISIVVLLFAR